MVDQTKQKEMSHLLLKGLLMSSESVFKQMKRKEIEKLGKAYGTSGKHNT